MSVRTESVSPVLQQSIDKSVMRSYPMASVYIIRGIAEKAMGYLLAFGNSPGGPCRILFRFKYPINPRRMGFFFCDVIVKGPSSSLKVLHCFTKCARTSEEVKHFMEDTSIPKTVTISGDTFILSDELINGMEERRDASHRIDLAELVGAFYKKKKWVRRKLHMQSEVVCNCKDSQKKPFRMVIRKRPEENPGIITAYYL
jgi:hypothetical protein